MRMCTSAPGPGRKAEDSLPRACLIVREVQCVACETKCACVRMPTECELL